jgi:hypothetical protein
MSVEPISRDQYMQAAAGSSNDRGGGGGGDNGRSPSTPSKAHYREEDADLQNLLVEHMYH